MSIRATAAPGENRIPRTEPCLRATRTPFCEGLSAICLVRRSAGSAFAEGGATAPQLDRRWRKAMIRCSVLWH